MSDEPNTQRTQFFLDALQEVVAMGLDIARAIHQDATAPASTDLQDPAPAATPAKDPTIPFERAARTIRRAIHLAHVLTQAKPAAPHPAPPNRAAARTRIIRNVEDSIQRETSGEHAAALHDELLDRMDTPDFDDDLATRTVGEIIFDICSDLGFNETLGTQPYKRRTPEDIELLRARAAAPPGRIRVWLSDKQHAQVFGKPKDEVRRP